MSAPKTTLPRNCTFLPKTGTCLVHCMFTPLSFANHHLAHPRAGGCAPLADNNGFNITISDRSLLLSKPGPMLCCFGLFSATAKLWPRRTRHPSPRGGGGNAMQMLVFSSNVQYFFSLFARVVLVFLPSHTRAKPKLFFQPVKTPTCGTAGVCDFSNPTWTTARHCIAVEM